MRAMHLTSGDPRGLLPSHFHPEMTHPLTAAAERRAWRNREESEEERITARIDEATHDIAVGRIIPADVRLQLWDARRASGAHLALEARRLLVLEARRASQLGRRGDNAFVPELGLGLEALERLGRARPPPPPPAARPPALVVKDLRVLSDFLFECRDAASEGAYLAASDALKRVWERAT